MCAIGLAHDPLWALPLLPPEGFTPVVVEGYLCTVTDFYGRVLNLGTHGLTGKINSKLSITGNYW